MRLRRIQASLLTGAAKVVLANLLRIEDAGLIDGIRVFTLPDLLKGFADGDDKAVAEVGRVLARRGTDWDARRSKVLQEIDRRRDAFARRLRAAGAATPHGAITSPG
jgi:hypothetical protein